MRDLQAELEAARKRLLAQRAPAPPPTEGEGYWWVPLAMVSDGTYLVGDNQGWCGLGLGPFHPHAPVKVLHLRDRPREWQRILPLPPMPIALLTDDPPPAVHISTYSVALRTWVIGLGATRYYWNLGWDARQNEWLISEGWEASGY